MGPLGIGLGVVSALGAAGGLVSGLMGANARKAEFAEQIRSLQFKKEQTLSTAISRAGASGIEIQEGARSASLTDYLTRQTAEFDRQIRSTRKAMRATYTAGVLGGLSGLLGSAASIYGSMKMLNPGALNLESSGPIQLGGPGMEG